jgi:hypothetical protein
MKGGLDNLGLHGLVKAFLMQMDYFWMLESGTESLFPSIRSRSQHKYPQQPFSRDLLSLVASIPTGFAALAYQCILSINVLGILSRVSSFMRTAPENQHGKSARPDPNPKDDETHPNLFEISASLQLSTCTKHSLEKILVLANNPNRSVSNFSSYRGSK